MTYIDTELSQRFARNCTTAAFGYARAASAAYAALANQTLDFWTQSARRDDYRPSKPYLVTSPRPYRSAVSPAPAAPAVPLDFFRLSNAWVASPMFAPVRAWWGLWPLEGNPASWPMAYAMMTAGVPRSVAMPAAEANVAAMEAAQAASTSIDRVFASYRTDGGFAVTPVVTSSKAVIQALFLAPLAPFTMAVRLPWA